MVASFIHDECISRADINNPLLNNHKKKFTLKNISFPKKHADSNYNHYATAYLNDNKLGDILLSYQPLGIAK